MVVVRHQATVASVVFSSPDSDGSVRNESLSKPGIDRVVSVTGGLLLASAAPTSYTAVFEASNGDVERKQVEARERLIAEPGHPMALRSDNGGDRVPLILVPETGKPAELVVEAADMPAMRRALFESGDGIVTINALDYARRKARLETSGRVARVLHVGPVPAAGRAWRPSSRASTMPPSASPGSRTTPSPPSNWPCWAPARRSRPRRRPAAAGLGWSWRATRTSRGS